MSESLIRLEQVGRSFEQRGQRVSVIEDLTLTLAPGEIVALVGESGCGKTTTGRMIAGLIPPSTGRILYSDTDIAALRGAERRAYRLGVGLIHQDPYASLNPAQRARDILAAPLKRHGLVRTRDELEVRLRQLLQQVELTPADEVLGKFPHQLSGGQRQRLSMARALSVRPSFLVADEAVSMVDVSIRLSLLDTLRHLRDESGLALLFITHDLALARHIASPGRIGVMYLGRLVELAEASELIRNPQHPYTRALLAASPPDPLSPRPRLAPLPLRGEEMPSLLHRPSGCPFHPRCPQAQPGLCDTQIPALVPVSPEHAVACTVVTGVTRAAATLSAEPSAPP